MAAGRLSPIDIRQSLVRLGHLCFDDFLLVEPETLDSGYWTPDIQADWILALNNAPHISSHLRKMELTSACSWSLIPHPASLADVLAAQQRLVTHFAYDLLRAKAPPLYDALPWHDWDFSIVTRRFPLWKTKLLLAGDGTTVTMCRSRKSAGVYVLELCGAIARYIERKAALERVRRFRLVSPKPQAASLKLFEIPLPDNSVDLAVIGSSPSLQTGDGKMVTQELERVSHSVLLIENNPLSQPLTGQPLLEAGFRAESVNVSGLGPRRCWWKLVGRQTS